MTANFMGLDVSTQSCKCIVINSNTHGIIYQDIVNYDRDLPQYQTENGVNRSSDPSISESDPQMWLDAIKLLFTRLACEEHIISQIQAISVSGQQHGLVTLDKRGRLSRQLSKLWNDFSTEEECRILTEKTGGKDAMIAAIANTQRTGYTAPKILHMIRHEPEAYARTMTVLLVHNYINWFLTGGVTSGIAVMEPGDVSGSALWDPVKKTWASTVINAIDSELLSKLPPVLPSRQLVGPIGAEFCRSYGFSPQCMIASGSGDNMMGAIGTGNVEEGIATVSLGTSGTAYTVMQKPFIDQTGEVALFCDALGNYLPLVCIANMANGYNALLQQFRLTHAQFSDLVKKIPPGNEGRIILPWYAGERTPDLPHAVPLYFGFQLEDFTPSILCRAVLEGHILNLYDGFLKIPIKPIEIRLTGGMAHSELWQETIANIFNCPVVPIEGEGVAFGAALHALWAFSTDWDIKDIVHEYISLRKIPRVVPNPRLVTIYQKLHRVYHALSQSIRGIPQQSPFELHHSLFRS